MASKYVWKALATSGKVPLPKSSHSLTVVGGKAYLFGGEHVSRVPVDNAVSALDLSSGTWSEVSVKGTPPPARNACSASAVGSKIYIFGGRTGIGMSEGSLNDLYVFDTEAEQWTTPDVTGALPPIRSYHSSATIGDTVFVFGGCGQDDRYNDLHALYTAKNEWTKLPSCDDITPRGGAGFVAVGDCLYVIGGFCGHEVGDTHVFNVTKGTWSTPQLNSPLPPRSVFGTSVVGSKIFVIGGEVDPSATGHCDAGMFSSDCYVMDTNDNSGWHKAAVSGDELSPRGWFSAASWEDKAVVYGGLAQDNSRLGDVLILSAA